ncbi:hypothetical protein J4Q44_G00280850 [Coregonus suidteri]|uniref:Uncharacterized protein n=1 Tax=Coregonus suidteri TaxID=861788 RepID=A0AAN8QU50_9TELE
MHEMQRDLSLNTSTMRWPGDAFARRQPGETIIEYVYLTCSNFNIVPVCVSDTTYPNCHW